MYDLVIRMRSQRETKMVKWMHKEGITAICVTHSLVHQNLEFEMVNDSLIPTSHLQDTKEHGWCTCLSSYLIVPSSDALHNMYGVSGAVASLFTRPI